MADLDAMVREWAAAWTAHDMKRVCALFTDDCVYEDVTLGVVNHGTDELAAFGDGFIAIMPDVAFELTSVVVGSSAAAAEWTMTGTQRGEMNGLPATGRSCEVRGVSALVSDGDQLARCRDYWDLNTLLRQLGHID